MGQSSQTLDGVNPLSQGQRGAALGSEWENPFFLKELRSLGRHGFTPLAWPLLLQSVLLLLPLLVVEGLLAREIEEGPFRRGVTLSLIFLIDAIVWAISGWSLGGRVFGEERRLRTLEGVLLVAMPPARWFPQKLLFPLYGLVLLWTASLPLHAAFVLRHHFLPYELATGWLLAACAGLTALGAAVLAPEGGKPAAALQRRVSLELLAEFAWLALPYWIGMNVWRLAWQWIVETALSMPGAFRPVSFYWGTLHPGHGLAFLLGAFLLAAAGGGFSTANPAGRWAPLIAQGTRAGAVIAAYYLFVGVDWTRKGLLYQVVASLGLPVGFLLVRWITRQRQSRREEDPRAAREIRLLGRWWDNPVFIRDLRVALRGAGLVRRLVFFTAALLVVAGVMSGLASAPRLLSRGGSLTTLQQFLYGAAEAGMVVGGIALVPLLMTLGSRATSHWNVERRTQTLSQLASSPLTSGTVVLGRWAAALLVGITRCLPVLVVWIPSYLFITQGRGIEITLAIGAWVVTLGLVLSAGMAGAARKLERLKDLGTAVCLALYVVLAEGILLGLLLNNVPTRVQLNLGEFIIGYACLMIALNLPLTYALYRRSVVDLERFRVEDIE